jgi:hypothetical protein
MFKCMMKSLPKVARTEVLQRNNPEDRSIKDQISCEKTLNLGRVDDIAKMMQMKGAKWKMSRRPTCAKGQPDRAEMGLGRLAQAGQPGPSRRQFGPPFTEREDDVTLSRCGCRHS